MKKELFISRIVMISTAFYAASKTLDCQIIINGIGAEIYPNHHEQFQIISVKCKSRIVMQKNGDGCQVQQISCYK